MKVRRRSFLGLSKKLSIGSAFLIFVSGCATPVHVAKEVDKRATDKAAQEIRSTPNWTPHYISDEDAEKQVLAIYKNLLPAATRICREVSEDECSWDIRYSSDEDVNAFASGESTVVIQKGILRHAENDDEVAMVIAHELSHHAADHIDETIQNARTGQLIGGLLLGALAGVASRNSYYQQSYINDGVKTGMAIGATIGKLSFSKAQEDEADFIGAHILYQSGYDPQKARKIWIKLARLGKTEHGEQHSFNTHPDPALRLARFDSTVGELASQGGKFGTKPRARIDLRVSNASVPPSNSNTARSQSPNIVAIRTTSLAPEMKIIGSPVRTHKRSGKQGEYSFEVEKLAKGHGCDVDGIGELLSGRSANEEYRVYCHNQPAMKFVCEWGDCQLALE